MSQTSRSVLCVLLLCGLATAAASESTTAPLRPLDLPSGGRGVEGEDEEDIPETIVFYGGEYEGDGFFFLLDRSGSMSGNRLEMLKVEMSSALEALSPSSEFGIVAFSSAFEVFSPTPSPAGPGEVAAACSWVSALTAYGATNLMAAALETLTLAQMSSAADRCVVVVGDGLPNNPGPDDTLVGILAANTEGLPFHTILIGAGGMAVPFMTNLAAQTGGTFRVVE